MNKNQISTIVIAGDSWGCGEWLRDSQSYSISHPGIAQYLHDSNHNVVNLSSPGGANITSSQRVEDFIKTNSCLQITRVIVFQTEWSRDLFLEDPDALSKELITDGYQGLKNRLISRFYRGLSEVALKNNIPIHLVGGCSDLMWSDQFETEYPGLHIACQSLFNLLTNGNHRNPDPVYCVFTKFTENDIKSIRKYLSDKDLVILLEDVDRGTRRAQQWTDHKEYFYPDGNHANRTGHRVLFEFLKTQIPNL
jgi:hypothetical protein